MSQRIVRLPNGRWVSLAVYVAAWQQLRAIVREAPQQLVAGFDHFAAPAADVLRVVRSGLDDRINVHAPHFGIGRRWACAWQVGCQRDARALNGRFRVHRFETDVVRRRFADREAVE